MHLAVPLTEQKALQMSLPKKSTRSDGVRRGSGVTHTDAVTIDFPYKKPVYNNFPGTLCDLLTDGLAAAGHWDPQISSP